MKKLFASDLPRPLGSATKFILGVGAFVAASVLPLKGGISLDLIGIFETGVFDESATEIAAFDPGTNRLFVTNADSDSLSVVDISDPTSPSLVGEITFAGLTDPGGPFAPNSVAVSNGVVAVALEADATGDNGIIAFYDAALDVGTDGPLDTVTAGALPDMVTFTPDGTMALAANEGEAEESGETAAPSVNPEGSITVIGINGTDATTFSVGTVTELTFAAFEPGGSMELGPTLEDIKTRISATEEAKVRIHPNAPSVSADLEPEYITVSEDSREAYVALQENNAVAIIDLTVPEIINVAALGYKDHSLQVNALDANKNDEAVGIVPQPFYGMYMPDAITNVTIDGETFILSANEGDGRDPEDFGALDVAGSLGDEADLKDLTLDATAFPNAATLQDGDGIGDLGVSAIDGDIDGDGEMEEIYTQGARSFTIWDASNGSIVFDSGSQFERITASFLPENFNTSNDDTEIDDRSDNKGPEPEAVEVGRIGDNYYAFIGLERIGGVMVYDITDPRNPFFVNYTNERDFSLDVENQIQSGPEDILFIPASTSPNGNDLIVVTSEVSGDAGIYEVEETDLITLPRTLLRNQFRDELTGISTRGLIGSEQFGDILNSSIIIIGSPANVIFRGRSTSINLEDVEKLPDPRIDVVRIGEGVVATNDNWADAENLDVLEGTPFDPETVGMGETEAILILLNLKPGAYSVRVSSAVEGDTGLAISEALIAD